MPLDEDDWGDFDGPATTVDTDAITAKHRSLDYLAGLTVGRSEGVEAAMDALHSALEHVGVAPDVADVIVARVKASTLQND